VGRRGEAPVPPAVEQARARSREGGRMKVPFADLRLQYASIKTEIDSAIQGVVESSEFIGGKALRAFEGAFAEAHASKHCIGVANGTDALVVVLKCLGIGPGDTVATAANSFIAT